MRRTSAPRTATGPRVHRSIRRTRWTRGAPRLPIFPAPRFERIRSLPEHPPNLTRTEMVVHVGTHVDSPRHFFNDGPAFREIPVTRLSGLGRVRGIRPGMAR